MRIKSISPEQYKGYALASYVGRPELGFLAAWRKVGETKWIEGHVYVDTEDDAFKLAKECIDFNEKVDAKETELGRKLTLDEMLQFGKD